MERVTGRKYARAAGFLLGMGALVLAACAGGGSVQPTLASGATPACPSTWPVVHPKKIAPGKSVILRDKGLRCRPYAKPQIYNVLLAPPARVGGLPNYDHLIRLTSFRVGRSGAFSVTVTLPMNVKAGSAQLLVRNRALDRRLKCPPSASCRYFSAGIRITQT